MNLLQAFESQSINPFMSKKRPTLQPIRVEDLPSVEDLPTAEELANRSQPSDFFDKLKEKWGLTYKIPCDATDLSKQGLTYALSIRLLRADEVRAIETGYHELGLKLLGIRLPNELVQDEALVELGRHTEQKKTYEKIANLMNHPDAAEMIEEEYSKPGGESIRADVEAVHQDMLSQLEKLEQKGIDKIADASPREKLNYIDLQSAKRNEDGHQRVTILAADGKKKRKN